MTLRNVKKVNLFSFSGEKSWIFFLHKKYKHFCLCIFRVPKTICFGQAAVRSFYSHHEQRHCQQRFKMEVDTTTDIEQVDMDALATALEECS